MKQATDIQQKVVVQTNTICNMGTVRYRLANALNGQARYTLTDEFKNAIRLLPLTYDAIQYTQFLDYWGTVSQLGNNIIANCMAPVMHIVLL